MTLKAGTVDFVDTETIVELFALTDGTVQFIGWQGSSGNPVFEVYTEADGSGNAYPVDNAFGYSFLQGQSMGGVTGSLYMRCTDLGGESSQPVSYLGWDAS
jgi:hypothetical protein